MAEPDSQTWLEVDPSVELRTVADLEDTATSSKYFCEGDADISNVLWRKVMWIESRPASQRELQAHCNKHMVPTGYVPMCRAGPACAVPPDGSICVYADALEAGMRLPLHDFYVAVLLHYGLAPSQLAPNAWRYMAAFVLLCEDAGVDPMLSVFRFFFSICNASGWYHFKHHAVPHPDDPNNIANRRLFTGPPRSTPDWKTMFFDLKSPPTTPWPCPVKWGMPCRGAVRVPPKTRETTLAMNKLLDKVGSSGLDLMSFLSRHSLPVGTQAPLTAEQRLMKMEKGAAGATAAATAGVTAATTAGATAGATATGATATTIGATATATAGATAATTTAGPEVPIPREQMGQILHSVKEAREGVIFMEMFVAQATQKDKELARLRIELAQHKEQLQQEQAAKVSLLVEQKQDAAKVARLTEQLKKHDSEVAQLTEELKKHGAEVATLKRKHAENIALLKHNVKKAVLDSTNTMMHSLSPKLATMCLKMIKDKATDR